MNKEWTIKNGVIGTHHKNRAGEYVDFRPSEKIGVDNYLRSDKKNLEEINIIVYPPKGQTISGVVVSVERIEKISSHRDNEKGTEWITYQFFAHFLGQEISAKVRGGIKFFDKEKEKKEDEEREKRWAQHNTQREEEKKFLDSLTEEDVINYPHDRRRLGRMFSRAHNVSWIVGPAVRGLLKEKFGNSDDVYGEDVDKAAGRFSTENIRTKLLEAEKRKKEERKKAWLLTRQEKK
ncbi:MAG: hypothetical protein M0P97_03170 [Candidatus Moranbacteria bacterium]|jgi:hypothetical protein|nr:hypothetical protein [Candidatus Moranbacteria bacterium]